jgi:hypothetical protein
MTYGIYSGGDALRSLFFIKSIGVIYYNFFFKKEKFLFNSLKFICDLSLSFKF